METLQGKEEEKEVMWRRRCSVKTEEDSVEGDGAGNIRKTSKTGKQGEKGEKEELQEWKQAQRAASLI